MGLEEVTPAAQTQTRLAQPMPKQRLLEHEPAERVLAVVE